MFQKPEKGSFMFKMFKTYNSFEFFCYFCCFCYHFKETLENSYEKRKIVEKLLLLKYDHINH